MTAKIRVYVGKANKMLKADESLVMGDFIMIEIIRNKSNIDFNITVTHEPIFLDITYFFKSVHMLNKCTVTSYILQDNMYF